jgi:hypothetical protein
MSHQPIHRLPWDDRWSEPTVEQLLQPLKVHHRRVFDHLMTFLAGLEGIEQSVIWYGPSWKWTLHYTLPAPAAGHPAAPVSALAGSAHSGNGSSAGLQGAKRSNGKVKERLTLSYLVPRVESPLVCVPLSEAVIEQLPLPRLTKVIREGIKMAKCAVSIHWATWSPSTMAETNDLMDLVKRYHKIVMPPAPARAKSK